MSVQLAVLAQQIHHQLKARGIKLVLAESCTGGMGCAVLTAVPGASDTFCGGWVTYSDESKSRWLRVERSVVRAKTSVSAEVTDRMALQALKLTPEAGLSVAITGHFGPGVPAAKDGTIYLSAALRTSRGGVKLSVRKRMRIASRKGAAAHELRRSRQLAASLSLLKMVRSLLISQPN